MKSPEKSRNLENVLEKIKKLKTDDTYETVYTKYDTENKEKFSNAQERND